MMEFYSESTCKARKEHKCHLCLNPIQSGEIYKRESGKYDGDFFDRCSHMYCNKIIREFCSEYNEYDEYDADWITSWLSDKYCYDCKEREDCETTALHCEKILKDFKEGDK